MPTQFLGYLGKDGKIYRWPGGKAIGTYKFTSSWKIDSYMSDRMYQVEAKIDGIVYVGRSLGTLMELRGKPKVTRKRQKK